MRTSPEEHACRFDDGGAVWLRFATRCRLRAVRRWERPARDSTRPTPLAVAAGDIPPGATFRFPDGGCLVFLRLLDDDAGGGQAASYYDADDQGVPRGPLRSAAYADLVALLAGIAPAQGSLPAPDKRYRGARAGYKQRRKR